jgi:hypothetical protein
MNLVIQPVAVNFANQTWPLVEKYITEAQKYSGNDYTLDQIKVYVNTGIWMLVVAVDEVNTIHGAATVNFINYPNDRVAFVTYIGGKLISSQDTFAQFKNVLKASGATKIQGAAREAIARLWHRYGFEERYIIVETKI